MFTAVLRGIAVIAIYLIITGFSLPIKKVVPQTAPIILIDASKSMESHMDTINAYLDDIAYDHQHRYCNEQDIVFSQDSIIEYGSYTDIISPLITVVPERPRAVLLLSDGNHNFQGAFLSQLYDYPVPVYTFGIGREQARDVELIEMLYPDYVYKGDSIEISAIVQSYGYDTGVATVKLVFDHSGRIMQRTFQLSKTKAKNMLIFHPAITDAADTSFVISIMPLPGEKNTQNNTQQSTIRLIDRRIQVLYYTDHASFTTKFVMNALTQHPRLDVTFIVRSQSGRYIDLQTGQQKSVPLLDTLDVLIIDNVSCSSLPWSHINDAVTTGLGLLCIGTVQQITPEFQKLLPITVAEAIAENSVPMTITEGFSCFAPGKNYPPFSFMHRVLGIKENAVAIAAVNMTPVIGYHRYGQGTVFQINCLDIGTWHFMQKGMFQQDIISCLFPDIIRFIAPVGQNKRLVLTSSKQTFAAGERIDLKLKSYDQDYRLAGSGDFSITINGRAMPFFETGKGMYHTSFIAEKTGNMVVAASGVLENEPLSSNRISIEVNKGSMEQLQTINRALLETIAEYTGGVYYTIDSLPVFTVPDVKPQYRVTRLDLNNPIGYLLILALLIADWIIRRRRASI